MDLSSKSKSKADTLPGGTTLRPRGRWGFVLTVVALAALLRFIFISAPLVRHSCMQAPPSTAAVCPQGSLLVPSKNGALWTDLTALHATTVFRDRAVAQLSAAVQIPTETFDNMGPIDEDERWMSREPFIEHLKGGVPASCRRHATLELQKVNTCGLFYTWQGSDTSLKPLLLMGHYGEYIYFLRRRALPYPLLYADVVPVAPLSADQWTFPPYSGHFDGESVWGRGSSDDKSGVIGIMMTIEVLLEKGFTPARTVVLSFGFDEEVGGPQGAGHLGPALLERFGPDSFAMVVDEGGTTGFSETFGAIFATPGVAEKGFVDVHMEVKTPGGHSSVPPAHTSIGILAALIVHLESNAPVSTLELGTPTFEMAACFAAHAPDIPLKLKRAILRAPKSKKALRAAEELLVQDKMFRAMVGTTQAVDIIRGGVKSNALPEQVAAVVNHRIATQSSVNATITRDAELVRELAARFNLSVTAYGELLTPALDAEAAATYGTLELSAPLAIEPAPITPSGRGAAPYALLAGTIKATFNAARKDAKSKEIFVAPGIMSGNTDTRYYWKLTPHIFRYNHGNFIRGIGGIHTVDEHIGADAFVEMVTFFTTLILNADEAEM
ncbi:Carboxypeptidase S [Mycena venus]|uniref:Carboxypeptidase S n=1 Tax=Mycena venus TaxID=2733690 RepID=A0A8H6XY43_9AGAR|nr:Carboxypeptidase S [Mycena venus]